jgi:hypothetical protein
MQGLHVLSMLAIVLRYTALVTLTFWRDMATDDVAFSKGRCGKRMK